MAAPLYDHDLGTYSDAFSDEVGITSKSNVGVDAISGVLMLTNAESGFTAPYHSSGYMVTSTILPVLVAEWGTVSIDATIPDGTSVRVQILDESNAVYSDTAFSGNMVGFTSFPVDISGLAVDRNAGNMSAKFGRIRVKVYLATDNTDITPEVNSITVSWTKTNGDVSGSGLSDGSLGMQGYTTSLISRNDQTSAFTFPVLNWVKALSNEWGGGILSRGPENVLYLKSNGGFSGESPKIYALDRDTGNDIWRRSLSGVSYSEPDHLLTYDNTMYFNDIFNDVLGSYDMTSGTIKWLKVHGYGHGSYVNVTDQGVIIYDQNKVSDAAENIYAVNPDGTERWVYPFDLTGTVASTKPALYGDHVIVGSRNWSGSTFLNEGTLFALDVDTGALVWEYATGDITADPIVDEDGTIYVANGSSALDDKYVYAFNPNGTIKWQQHIGVTADYYTRTALRSDDIIYLVRTTDTVLVIEARSTVDGSLLETIQTNEGYQCSISIDSENGLYVAERTYHKLRYFSSEYEEVWSYTFSDTQAIPFLQIEGDRAYISLMDTSDFVVRVISFAQLSPEVTVTPETALSPGDEVTVSFSSTLPKYNLLTGSRNYVQLVLGTGEKIPFLYQSSLSSGRFRWNVSFTLPEDVTEDSLSYHVEISAAGIETSTPTSFVTPASSTDNSGYQVSGSFEIRQSLDEDETEIPNVPVAEQDEEEDLDVEVKELVGTGEGELAATGMSYVWIFCCIWFFVLYSGCGFFRVG